jgi:hypothetical protein
MALYEITENELRSVPSPTLIAQGVKERKDLQRLLKNDIRAIDQDLLVIAEEFSPWKDSPLRIDLLAIDRAGSLVVIELKRSSNLHMELQALRYAAMVSTLKFEQAVEEYAKITGSPTETAKMKLLEFLDSGTPVGFGTVVRIILAAAEFDKEFITTLLWLNDQGLNIRCIRLHAYEHAGRTLIDIDRIVPLPEAEEYAGRIKVRLAEARQAISGGLDRTRYDLQVDGKFINNLSKRALALEIVRAAVAAGLGLDELSAILPDRKLLIVEGQLQGEAFLSAAKKVRPGFDQMRFFLKDGELLGVNGRTFALSNQWSIYDLDLLNKIIGTVPSASLSYQPSSSPA